MAYTPLTAYGLRLIVIAMDGDDCEINKEIKIMIKKSDIDGYALRREYLRSIYTKKPKKQKWEFRIQVGLFYSTLFD